MNRPRAGAGAPRARRWLPLTLAALVAASCGAHLSKLITLPTGAGTPAPDAGNALAGATAACRGVTTLTAETTVSGSVDGRRVPHAHLIVGIERPASVRIEATAPFGPPVFTFVSRSGEATLVLQRDNRSLEHGRPAEVLEALTGVPLDPGDLLATLTGCGAAPDAAQARHMGDSWIVMPDAGGQLFLQRATPNGGWTAVAATHAGGSAAEWRAEYHDFRAGLPQTIRLSATDRSRFDLQLALSQLDVNTTIDPAAFSVKVPASAVPITIAELRGTGALQ